MSRRLTPCLLAAFVVALVPPCPAAEPKAEKSYTTESLSGKVVWLSEALKDRFGIKTDDDVAHAVVALETSEGQLYPLLKDARGRGFHADERLRGVDMELLVRRYRGSPMVQVVRVYTLKSDGKYELDYWCDVCSIAMYELKPCECCQGPIRLRERLVEKRNTAGVAPGEKSPEKTGGVSPERKVPEQE
ncbi:MAG TPA: hypothetical protein VG826_33525 [Pirellulales bacterium]|nr:hypothetical protein [Pirellulales bacterium]